MVTLGEINRTCDYHLSPSFLRNLPWLAQGQMLILYSVLQRKIRHNHGRQLDEISIENDEPAAEDVEAFFLHIRTWAVQQVQAGIEDPKVLEAPEEIKTWARNSVARRQRLRQQSIDAAMERFQTRSSRQSPRRVRFFKPR